MATKEKSRIKRAIATERDNTVITCLRGDQRRRGDQPQSQPSELFACSNVCPDILAAVAHNQSVLYLVNQFLCSVTVTLPLRHVLLLTKLTSGLL
jgi:hypothetical protein